VILLPSSFVIISILPFFQTATQLKNQEVSKDGGRGKDPIDWRRGKKKGVETGEEIGESIPISCSQVNTNDRAFNRRVGG